MTFTKIFQFLFAIISVKAVIDYYPCLGRGIVYSWICGLSFILFRCFRNLLPRKQIGNLQNKAVFITGCDTGFGNLTAKYFDKLGIHVYAGCLFPDKEGAKNLQEECSNNLKIVPLDVTSQSSVDAALKQVESSIKEKELAAVINNAGVLQSSPLELDSISEINKALDVNTLGPVRIIKAFLPLLRKSKGRVVIVCSIASQLHAPFLAGYTASKAAIFAIANSLRLELIRWSISVHTVHPSIYTTNISNRDRIFAYYEETWKATNSDLKSVYGKNYLQTLKSTEKFLSAIKKPESRQFEVCLDLIDAAIGENPKEVYFPGPGSELLWSFIILLPRKLFDLTINICMYLASRNVSSKRDS